jgi:hypothetical protein
LSAIWSALTTHSGPVRELVISNLADNYAADYLAFVAKFTVLAVRTLPIYKSLQRVSSLTRCRVDCLFLQQYGAFDCFSLPFRHRSSNIKFKRPIIIEHGRKAGSLSEV